jgi:hypothetical protein
VALDGGGWQRGAGARNKAKAKGKRKAKMANALRLRLRVPRCTWSVRRPVSEPSAIIPPYTGKYGIHPFKRSSVSFHLASLFLTNSYAHVTVPNMYLIIFWHYYRNCNPWILLVCTAWADERKKMDGSLGGWMQGQEQIMRPPLWPFHCGPHLPPAPPRPPLSPPPR